jgi:hypothetical protein
VKVIGVGMAVIGDMSSRPNWGLNELDFVFRWVRAEITNLLILFFFTTYLQVFSVPCTPHFVPTHLSTLVVSQPTNQ